MKESIGAPDQPRERNLNLGLIAARHMFRRCPRFIHHASGTLRRRLGPSGASPHQVYLPPNSPLFAHSPFRPELKARRGARHADSKLVIVRGGMRSTMDIDPLDKIWSTALKCVGRSARPGAISGILSLVFIASFNLGSAKAQSTPPPSTPAPSASAQAEKTPEKPQPTPGPSIKVQTSPKVTEVLNSPPLAIKDEDTQVIRLKKMRFNMALTEARDRYTLFRKGLIKLYDLIDVGQRVLAAQADLAQSPEERADVLQKQLEIFAEAEDSLQKQIKEGKAESADLDHLRYERLGVEIDLETLRRGMAE